MELPPVIRIALEEGLGTHQSAGDLRNVMLSHGLNDELTAQSEWTLDRFSYVDSVEGIRADHFTVAPSGALNPFSHVAKCVGKSCTAKSTNEFIKTVGLYSDTAVIPDPLTLFFRPGETLSEDDYKSLFRQFSVLEQIRPLIESGVILFGDPVRWLCNHCVTEMERQLSETTGLLVSTLRDYTVKVLEPKKREYLLGIQIPLLQPDHDHTITNYTRITEAQARRLSSMYSRGKKPSKAAEKLVHNIISRRLERDVNTIFLEMDLSRRLGALLLAGSRAETLIIRALDNGAPRFAEIEDWESLRTIHLPWIEILTPEEVLILRSEASKALPRLRELLKARLTVPSSKDPHEAIAELRTQAFEVQAELDSLNIPKERRYRAGMLGLAMSFVIYGFASQAPPVVAGSLAALLATLAHIRNAEREQEAQEAKLVSMPGYALLKAQEILARR